MKGGETRRLRVRCERHAREGLRAIQRCPSAAFGFHSAVLRFENLSLAVRGINFAHGMCVYVCVRARARC